MERHIKLTEARPMTSDFPCHPRVSGDPAKIDSRSKSGMTKREYGKL